MFRFALQWPPRPFAPDLLRSAGPLSSLCDESPRNAALLGRLLDGVECRP